MCNANSYIIKIYIPGLAVDIEPSLKPLPLADVVAAVFKLKPPVEAKVIYILLDFGLKYKLYQNILMM